MDKFNILHWYDLSIYHAKVTVMVCGMSLEKEIYTETS